MMTAGENTVDIHALLLAAATLAITYLISRLAKRSLQAILEKVDTHDDLTSPLLAVVTLTIWIIGLELALNFLGIRLTSLFAASGFLALGAGFAVKNIVENFLSGGILRMERTISAGDIVLVQDKWAQIEHIGLRTTKAMAIYGEEILIPNSEVAQSIVTNLTRQDRYYRVHVDIGVSYESDLDEVQKTLQDTVGGLEWNSESRDTIIYLKEFADSSIVFTVAIWVEDLTSYYQRRSDLLEAIWRSFRKQGIVIAYPQIDVHLKPSATT